MLTFTYLFNPNIKYRDIGLPFPLKKTIEPCPKFNRKCNGFNGYNGFNGNYNGVYWYVMDFIAGMLNPIGKNAQNTLQKGIL